MWLMMQIYQIIMRLVVVVNEGKIHCLLVNLLQLHESWPTKKLCHISSRCAGENEWKWVWQQFRQLLLWCVRPWRFYEGYGKFKLKVSSCGRGQYLSSWGWGEKSILLQVGDTVDSYLVKISKVSDDWVGPPPNENKGEPHFREAYNPVRWSGFYFWPKF